MFVAFAAVDREQRIISILLERSTLASVTLPSNICFAVSPYTVVNRVS